jgi:hypothetical protein
LKATVDGRFAPFLDTLVAVFGLLYVDWVNERGLQACCGSITETTPRCSFA